MPKAAIQPRGKVLYLQELCEQASPAVVETAMSKLSDDMKNRYNQTKIQLAEHSTKNLTRMICTIADQLACDDY
jgi:hypothetical protein